MTRSANALVRARVLKKTGSFYYHCDWHASHHVKAKLHQILAFDLEHKFV